MATAIPPSNSTISLLPPPVASYWGQELQKAIETNDFKKCSSFVEKNPEILHSPLPNGEMPLHFAVRRCRHEFVKSILQNPTLPTEGKDHQGLTPADHALFGGDQNMIALVLGHRIGKSFDAAQVREWSKEEQRLLHQLVQTIVMERSKDLEYAPELHRAAGMGNLEEVKLLATPQNIEISNSYGMNTLQYAVLFGKEDVVNWLIGQNCRIDLLTQDRKSLLHLAAIGGNERVIQILLQTKKLDPNGVDLLGRTPLHYAMAGESFSVVRSLIQLGADPTGNSYKTGNGKSLSPLDAMVGIARERMLSRDPLALNQLQLLLFTGIAAPWISHYCGGVPSLEMAGLLANILSTVKLYRNLKSVKAKLAFLALFPVSRLPGFNALYRGWTAYIVGKDVIQGLSACWKNRFYETKRPIRNAIIHSVIGLDVGKAFVDSANNTYQVGFEIYRFKQDWDHLLAMQGDAYANLRSYEKFFFFMNFWNDYQNKPSPCSEPVRDCILREDLKPKDFESHADFILSLSGKDNCKSAYLNLSKQFHPDKNKGDPRADELFIKIQESARKMGCVKD